MLGCTLYSTPAVLHILATTPSFPPCDNACHRLGASSTLVERTSEYSACLVQVHKWRVTTLVAYCVWRPRERTWFSITLDESSFHICTQRCTAQRLWLWGGLSLNCAFWDAGVLASFLGWWERLLSSEVSTPWHGFATLYVLYSVGRVHSRTSDSHQAP